ncbi:MAG: type I phosphomannose isomerase catalytic subunit [Planctomycetota bacterium]
MTSLKPVHLERLTQSKIWGGHNLADLFGIRSPDGEPVGETWELFDRPEDGSRLRGGGTLRELMAHDRRGLLGRDVAPGHGGYFPLLFKFLDAQTSLSVQVHPDDAAAAAHGDGGKTEAWIVLRTLADARIVRGFKPGVTRAQLEAAVRGPEIEELLHQFRPQEGDCIHVPAGTVHAIGPGAVIFEVQQNSDITWRLYDWGRNRTVHVELGLEAARIDDGTLAPTVPPQPLPDGGRLLLQNPFFRLRRYDLREKREFATHGAFLVVTVLGGQGTLGWHSGGADLPLRLVPGDCVLVPASTEAVYVSPIGQLDVIVTDCRKS